MATWLNTKKKDKGYHIRNLDLETRRMAKAEASMAGVNIGTWIAQAIKEKFAREKNLRAIID